MLKERELMPLLDKFILNNKHKYRKKSNGNFIEDTTNRNYKMLEKMLINFELDTKFKLQIIEQIRPTEREKKKAKKYWINLYRNFTDYLYTRRGHVDNYVGQNVKLLKAFLNWLSVERGMQIGSYYKQYYVSTEKIPIMVLEPEMLRYLITDQEFEKHLCETLLMIKDLFVFGCTVGLRYSDLKKLTAFNIENIGGKVYLVNLSQKTNTRTRVMLPEYAINILSKYKTNNIQGALLPYPELVSFNEKIKKLGEQAGWVHKIQKIRMRRGRPIEIKTKENKSFRFCDLLSSHCMRRTAISTLLRLGLEENLVRKISGHTPGSKEFYRYVEYSQSFMDEELTKIHLKFDKKC